MPLIFVLINVWKWWYFDNRLMSLIISLKQLMINGLWLAMFHRWMFHYIETTTIAWFVNLWCHIAKNINYMFVHRRKAVVRHNYTMCSKITSLNLIENINKWPLKKTQVKMGCTIPISRGVCDFASVLDIFCGARTLYMLSLLLLIDIVHLTSWWSSRWDRDL